MTQQLSGLFISFEGIDGAGKTTHIGALQQAFEAAGRVVTLTREPGGTPLAEQLRTLVLNAPMDTLTEALLIFAARRDHVQQVIVPALARGDVVLCDRFTDASFAYQGAGRGFDLKVLATLENWVQSCTGLDLTPERAGSTAALLQPALTIWFDLPPAHAAERLQDARVPDKFEAQPLEFFTRVAHGYAEREKAQPQRFARINAAQDRDQVWQDVLQAVVGKGWLA